MTLFQALALGLIQGLTEFLPISSSAHLILTSWLLGWPDQGLAFDMAANSGSLLAVLAYLRGDLRRLAVAGRSLLPGAAAPSDPAQVRLLWAILVATVPVALAGLLAQDLLAAQARGPLLIGATSILFGLLLGWADRSRIGRRDLGALGLKAAMAVGLAQVLALIPGTSRSGVTITAGLFLGLSREQAARFAFLLAVPVGLLVAAKQALDLGAAPAPAASWGHLALGFAAAGASAYLAIGWLLAWLRRQSLQPFVIYRVILGLLILGLATI